MIKKYTDNLLNVLLYRAQEEKLDEMMSNKSCCIKKGIYSKSDAVRNS